MQEVVLIKHPSNGSFLRYKLSKNNLFLGLINGKNMRGVAIPLTSVLVKSPAYDMFIKNALHSGFTQSHINGIEITAMTQMLVNTGEEIQDLVAKDPQNNSDLIEPYQKVTQNFTNCFTRNEKRDQLT